MSYVLQAYADYPMRWVPYDVIETALRRCSKRDRELVMAWVWKDRQRERATEIDRNRSHQRYRDLERVVRDQRAHIANLEAQLLPHLVSGTGGNPQEALPA